MFISGMIGVGDCHAEEVSKHRCGLIKGDPMLAEILCRLGCIPFKFQAPTVYRVRLGLTEIRYS
jgi:hypothetical protein